MKVIKNKIIASKEETILIREEYCKRHDITMEKLMGDIENAINEFRDGAGDTLVELSEEFNGITIDLVKDDKIIPEGIFR